MIRNKLLRKRVLERDQGICAICQRFDPKWEADHILARWAGGKDDIDNMQTLCRIHHAEKTVSEAPVRAKTARLAERHQLMQRRRQVTR